MNASHVLLSCIYAVILSACCNCPEETICIDHGVILKKEAHSVSRTVIINKAHVATASYARHFITDSGKFSVDMVTFWEILRRAALYCIQKISQSCRYMHVQIHE